MKPLVVQTLKKQGENKVYVNVDDLINYLLQCCMHHSEKERKDMILKIVEKLKLLK